MSGTHSCRIAAVQRAVQGHWQGAARGQWSLVGALPFLLVAVLASASAVGGPQEASCGPLAAADELERYTRDDVLAGRLPGDAPITRATLGIGDKRIDIAVVTDAGRDRLAPDWPPLRRRARLMLVALESGARLWELVVAEEATASATHAGDPRLSAALGAASALMGADGVLRRLYVGDAAGRVWRVDLPVIDEESDAVTDWQLDLLAALAPDTAPTSVAFKLPPDLVRSVDSDGVPFDGLVLVSEGAPSAALPARGNGTFFLRDYAVAPRRSSDGALTPITWSDLTTATPAAAGWFAPFVKPDEVAQHRPLADGGRVFLITAEATADCDEPPLARTYIFNIADGRPLADTVPGSVAGVGRLGAPRIDDHAIVLPGRGIALPAVEAESLQYRKRFTAAGVGTAVSYWRDLLLDAD